MTPWRNLIAHHSPPRGTRTAVDFLRFLWRHFREDDCPRSAAALTLLSLFALVPMMTVVYTILSTVPVFAHIGAQIEDFIFIHFVPSSGRGVQSYLQQFSTQARQLTGIGILFVVITALTLMKEIETTLNAIWRVQRPRGGVASFLLYWAVLTLGPLLISAAFVISTYLLSLRVFADGVGLIDRGGWLRVLPLLLTWAALTLAFSAIPNCKVQLRHSLLAGLAAALAIELCKYLFTRIVANTSYSLIYGAFATIPLFLLWVYLCWMIVLVGAELSHALSTYDSRRTRSLPDLLLALAVLELFWQRQQHGDAVRERHLLHRRWLLGRYRLAGDRWGRLAPRLQRAGLLRRDEQGNWLLGRDLHNYTLAQLCDLLHPWPAVEPALQPAPAWLQRGAQLLGDVAELQRQRLELPLAELFAASPNPSLEKDRVYQPY
jgi:membrane protein